MTETATVTLALSGLPDSCPNEDCGEQPPDGEWPVGVNRLLLVVICPGCHTAIANVHAVAATDPGCE